MANFSDKVASTDSLRVATGTSGATIDAIKITPTANAAAANVLTITNASMGQATTLTIPDPGVAAANIGLTTNIATSANSTIVAAAGAANTATVTVTLKDASGNALTNIQEFTVYASSAADGLTRASAASTGFSVASGGMSMANGTAVTTQITAMTSATGTCVLSLLDTGKQTSYLVLVLPNGQTKISAQLSAGSYG